MLKGIRNKVIVFIFLVAFVGVESAFAQRWKLLRYQVGAGVGTTQIFGDIGGTADEKNWFGLKDISFSETKMAYGVFARYKINSLFSVKANLNMGFGKGSDLNSRNNRGRSYKAKFYEFSGQIEHYFFSEEPRYGLGAMFNKRGMLNNYSTISGYTFIGFGVTYSSLQHNYGEMYLPYDNYKASNIAPVIPFGIGAKYVIDSRWLIGGEFGYRWALSDYIEGYKQTSSSKHADIYYFLMFSANYRLKTNRRGIPDFLDRKSNRRR